MYTILASACRLTLNSLFLFFFSFLEFSYSDVLNIPHSNCSQEHYFFLIVLKYLKPDQIGICIVKRGVSLNLYVQYTKSKLYPVVAVNELSMKKPHSETSQANTTSSAANAQLDNVILWHTCGLIAWKLVILFTYTT